MTDPPSEVTVEPGSDPDLPQVQRVAAYAVIVRDDDILLSRLAPRVTSNELWTLPGGGVDHGEHPRDAVVREVWEETGQVVEIADTARVYSGHLYGIWREGRRVDAHAVRVVYSGWVRQGSDPPRVIEENGSTCAAAWVPIADVLAGKVPVVAMVKDAISDAHPSLLQRIAAYALIRRDESVLLTRLSPIAPNAGQWTLPGGGLDHGESPAHAAAREVAEECGVECQIGALVGVHDVHFTGTAPNGHTQDYHGIHVVYDATIDPAAEPRVAEKDGTTDAVAWVPVADIESGAVTVLDVVRWALSHRA
jgi:8-oxo-dGTP diphosphatase